MTTRVLRGSKQQIAKDLAALEGEIREAIVFIDEASTPDLPAGRTTVDEFFEEMEPFTLRIEGADDSRRAVN